MLQSQNLRGIRLWWIGRKRLFFLGKIPFEFSVNPNETLEDYLADDLGIPLMSERLMQIINSHITGKEQLRWYEAFVNYGDKKMIYYAPYFKDELDVLDNEMSVFNQRTGSIIKATFSINKIDKLAFFPHPQLYIKLPFRLELIVSDEIKKDIIKEKLTGISFFRASVVL